MLEVLQDLPDGVLGIRARGKVTAEDYKTVLVPALEDKAEGREKLRLIYVLGHDFDALSGAAVWEDAKAGMRHLTHFDRIAVVTDVDWISHVVKAFGFILPADLRLYGIDELADARTWISEGA